MTACFEPDLNVLLRRYERFFNISAMNQDLAPQIAAVAVTVTRISGLSGSCLVALPQCDYLSRAGVPLLALSFAREFLQ